jgi:anti-sigma factor ChrR (cupin superfamily)
MQSEVQSKVQPTTLSAMLIKDLWNIVEIQDQVPWQPFRQGIEIYWLYGEGGEGAAAALLRYAAGATVPQHTHQGFEHILVLSGSQTDHNGVHQQGTLVINSPGSHHNVISETGCIVLIIWEKPVMLWS